MFITDPFKLTILSSLLFLVTPQVLAHTQMQMNVQPSEDDLTRNHACIREAKALFPQHETVALFEADMLANEGKVGRVVLSS
jgi:hypothetical protein